MDILIIMFLSARLNNFYELKASYGQQFLLGGKGNKNGVAVTYLYSGGLSLGMLKQYVLDVYPAFRHRIRMFIQVLIQPFLTVPIVVYDTKGLGGGWNHLNVCPGSECKTRHAIRLWPL